MTRFQPDDYIQAFPLDLVSEELKSLLEQYNAHVKFYPVQLHYRRRPYLQRRYFALHILDIVDCFDYERGEYVFWKQKPGFTERVDKIRRLAIDEEKASAQPLCRIANGGEHFILACDELAAAINAQGLSGLRFVEPESDDVFVVGPPHICPDEAASHVEIRRLMSEMHGELSKFESFESGEPPVTVYATTNRNNRQTIFTVGMSDYDLALPLEFQSIHNWINTELKLFLPPDWPLSLDSIHDPLWGWPIHWIHKIARDSHDAEQWPDDLATVFMNGDPPEPFAENTLFCGWLCVHEEEEQYKMPDGSWVEIRLLIPIYREEIELIRTEGYLEFLHRCATGNIPLQLKLGRPNMAKNGSR